MKNVIERKRFQVEEQLHEGALGKSRKIQIKSRKMGIEIKCSNLDRVIFGISGEGEKQIEKKTIFLILVEY